MSKIYIVYWSQTGNTQTMADAIGKGVAAAGKEAKVVSVGDISAQELENEACYALGCPAMGDEVLEEDEMEPFVSELEAGVSGKNIALFGSYGWGDGQWMRDWVERMSGAGAKIINGEGLICQDMPDEDVLKECEELGKKLAEAAN